MDTLSKDQLIAIRNAIYDVIKESNAKRNDLVARGNMKPYVSETISTEYEIPLHNIARDFNSAFFTEVITDIQEPGNRIIKATNNVNAAIKQLQDVSKLIDILTVLTKMAKTILMAVVTKNPLQLADLLSQIETIV